MNTLDKTCSWFPKSSCEYDYHDQEYNAKYHQEQACLRVNEFKTIRVWPKPIPKVPKVLDVLTRDEFDLCVFAA